MDKLRSFFFHYNKAMSKKTGHSVLTVHYKGACHFTPKIVCKTFIESKNNKRQPFCVMKGKTRKLIVKKDFIEIS